MDLDLRITLHKLQVLTTVVQLGGVSRAAEALYVSQPVVSAHIRSLDERLGVKIFYREGRELRLTEAGEVVHQWAQDVLTRTREADRHLAGLSGGQRGAIHLGSSKTVGSYLLPPLLADFRRDHPGAEIVCAVLDTEHAVEETRTALLDFAVVVTSPEADYPGLDVRVIGEDELILVAAPGSIPNEPLTLKTLGDLPFIEAEGTVRRTYVDRRLRELGVGDRKIAMQLGHPEAMKRAALSHLGVTMLFRGSLREDLERGTLVELPVAGLCLTVPISIISRHNKTFSPLHLEMLDRISNTI